MTVKGSHIKLVTVSCGTKFHSDYMAYQLSKFGLLKTVITSHPHKQYLNRVKIPLSQITFLPPIFILSHFAKKLLGNPNRISKWLDYRTPLLFDTMAAKSLKNPEILISWAWSGLKTIKEVKKRGGIAIVEDCGSCNLFQNRLLKEEYSSLGLNFVYPTPNYIIEREIEEITLADYILCPSKHVANSFISQGIHAKKCIVIPYGVNLSLFKPLHLPKGDFTVLFVGTVGVRKGLIYLFKALELLQQYRAVKCVIIGKVEEQFRPIFNQYSRLFTHIEKVPHHDLITYYNQASVFVLPSLDEGMAYVQLEAMACGLPVICTPNSGGDSVVEDGVEGFIVPIRDYKILAGKIEILRENKELKKQFSENALKKAAEFNWDNYGKKLASFVNSISNG